MTSTTRYKSCYDCMLLYYCKYAEMKVGVGTKVKDTLHECMGFRSIKTPYLPGLDKEEAENSLKEGRV